MSLFPLALAGALGAWLLVARGPQGVNVTSGSVELVVGELYRFTYATKSPLELGEASLLVTPFKVTGFSVANGAAGYRTLSFTGRASKRVKVTIGAALLAARPDIELVQVRGLGA